MLIGCVLNGVFISLTSVNIGGYDITKNITVNFEKLQKPGTASWAALGDSITQGWYSYIGADEQPHSASDSTKGWVGLVGKATKVNLTNYGIGGIGYLYESSGNCGWRVAQGIDFSDFDYVTLAYGINDWKGNVNLGTMSDDYSGTPTTLCGAIRKTIETILTSNPKVKVFLITPLNAMGYSFDYGDESTNWGLGYTFSNSGTLEDVFELMETICDYYSIQMIDMSHCSVINRKNIGALLLDGVHPSEYGHKQLARELSTKITFDNLLLP